MKTVFSVLGVIAVLAGVYFWFSGSPRIEVFTETALKKIDSLLGNLDVKRKEIDLSVRSSKEAINGIGKAKIKAKLKHDQIDARAEPYREDLARADASLKTLRAYLAANEPVKIGGQTYSPAELSSENVGDTQLRSPISSIRRPN